MAIYPAKSVERAMKFQEVILRAMSKQITWMQAAEILGMSDRNMRRYRSGCGVRRGGQGNPPMRLGRLFARERRLYN